MGNITGFLAWLDKFHNGIWAWCMDSVVVELGSFKFIGFSDGSLVWTIVFRATI